MTTTLLIRDEQGDMAAITGMASPSYAIEWAARHKIEAKGWKVLGTAYSMGERGALDELRKMK